MVIKCRITLVRYIFQVLIPTPISKIFPDLTGTEPHTAHMNYITFSSSTDEQFLWLINLVVKKVDLFGIDEHIGVKCDGRYLVSFFT